MPRCPECLSVIDIYLAAGTGNGNGRCPTHGLVKATYVFACDPDESAGQA